MENIKSDNHLTYFKVDNFKCFDSFELEDIGFVNLILGDNNVGKTSVLEALTFENNLTVFNSTLKDLLLERDLITSDAKSELKVNAFRYFISKNKNVVFPNKMRFSLKTVKFENQNLNSIIELFKEDGGFYAMPATPLQNKMLFLNGDYATLFTDYNTPINFNSYTSYLSSNGINEDLVGYYEETLQKNTAKKKQFIEQLKYFVIGIQNIEISISKDQFLYPLLIVSIDGVNEPQPLSMFGDGTIKFFKLLMAITMFQNNRLMIDEIDNGIHHSRMKEVWRATLKSAITNKTQLFITTHDSECLKAFKEVLEETEFLSLQNEVRNYTLVRNTQNKIQAIKYNFAEFEHAVNYDLNVRGGLL
jgi:AAA15 family ATPase/GTPase